MNTNDEMLAFLKRKFPDRFVTYERGRSILLIGRKKDNQLRLCLYTVRIPKDIFSLDGVRDYLCGDLYYRSFEGIGEKTDIPTMTIFFPYLVDRDDLSFIIRWNGNDRFISSESLKTFLLRIIDVQDTDVKPKPINSHATDLFHEWSRINLPSGDNGIIKTDIDGLLTDPLRETINIITEIKRSSIPHIPKWKPYPDDYSGLELIRVTAQKLGCGFWILHHEGKTLYDDTRISVFKINTSRPIGAMGPSYLSEQNPIMLNEFVNSI